MMGAGPRQAPGALAPDFSLVVPCYNEARHLRASVRDVVDVLEATGWTWEIVFVEDASTDDTPAIVREICVAYPNCRAIFHDRNRGRGAAFKTGFAASTGRVTGFLDIDLEVHARDIPRLVAELERTDADVVTGRRHYLLRQTGGLHRAAASWAYRRLANFLLSLDLEDSETGCKFFRRDSAGPIVLGSDNDGWFWDTEVMARARLAGLRIEEVPVKFVRRADKSSTVRFWRDSWHYLRALHDFRGVVGLSRRTKSPVYWTGIGYNLTMQILYGGAYGRVAAAVAARIADGASVVDVCCGTARLHRDFLRARGCSYLGLDFNGDFVMHARRRGTDARWFNLESDPLPGADYVVICSSLYHFTNRADEIVSKLRRAARRAVIISEPVKNLSQFPALGRLAAALTDPGVGDGDGHLRRFDLPAFAALVARHGGQLTHAPGDRNALAELPPL